MISAFMPNIIPLQYENTSKSLREIMQQILLTFLADFFGHYLLLPMNFLGILSLSPVNF